MKDSQRTAVYRWEGKIQESFPDSDPKMTLDECEALVVQVWEDYHPGSTPPSVLGETSVRRKATGSRWHIVLPCWAWQRIRVLHEIAHSLQKTEPWHGPEFARLMLDLLARYAGIPKSKAKSIGVHQKPRRVRFAALAASIQQPTRAWKQWKKEMHQVAKQLTELSDREPRRFG